MTGSKRRPQRRIFLLHPLSGWFVRNTSRRSKRNSALPQGLALERKQNQISVQYIKIYYNTAQAFKEAPSFTLYKMLVNDRRMNNSRVQKNMKTKAGLAPCEGLNGSSSKVDFRSVEFKLMHVRIKHSTFRRAARLKLNGRTEKKKLEHNTKEQNGEKHGFRPCEGMKPSQANIT